MIPIIVLNLIVELNPIIVLNLQIVLISIMELNTITVMLISIFTKKMYTIFLTGNENSCLF